MFGTNNHYIQDDGCGDEILFVPFGLSRKFWSAENFGPGDQNSWKIGPPDHYYLVHAWNYGPSENTLV